MPVKPFVVTTHQHAERLARRWRATAYVLLALLIGQSWLAIDTALELQSDRQVYAHWRGQVFDWKEQTTGYQQDLRAEKRRAEEKFRVCLSANAGLVETLHKFDQTTKAQKLLIKDAIELARRCDAQPVQWTTAGVIP